MKKKKILPSAVRSISRLLGAEKDLAAPRLLSIYRLSAVEKRFYAWIHFFSRRSTFSRGGADRDCSAHNGPQTGFNGSLFENAMHRFES